MVLPVVLDDLCFYEDVHVERFLIFHALSGKLFQQPADGLCFPQLTLFFLAP